MQIEGFSLVVKYECLFLLYYRYYRLARESSLLHLLPHKIAPTKRSNQALAEFYIRHKILLFRIA